VQSWILKWRAVRCGAVWYGCCNVYGQVTTGRVAY